MITPLDLSRKLIRREPLKHDKPRWQSQVGEKKPVTVCVACLCNWTYAPNDFGRAAVTASDREITAGDVEYEPPQFKVSFQGKRAIILIAGDYPTHSAALQQTQRTIARASEEDPATVAEIYASSLRSLKFKHACDIYLSPLGLKSDIFTSKSDIPNDLLVSLANQVQSYAGQPTEAIVVAGDDADTHLYLVDSDSKVTCQDDVGFVAIGIGAWHAKSLLMQAKYFNRTNFAMALSLAHSAKKRAEIAPGVGKSTDMFIVNRTGWAPVAPELLSLVDGSYLEYEKRHTELLSEQFTRLGEAFAEIAAKAQPPNASDAQAPPSAKPETEQPPEKSVAAD
jgi:hypothetical protein